MLKPCLLVACATLAVSCGTLRGGRRWGEDATLAPGGERLAKAARDAACDPWTWVPLAGAGVLTISDWDEDIARWARDDHPVFGSAAHAESAGQTLRGIEQDAWIASLIATPSGDEAGPWTADKAKGFAVEWAATSATSGLTSALKSDVHRERPDGSNAESFPSSGASDTFAFHALARSNLDSIDMSDDTRGALRIGLGSVAAAEAWSRVEAGKHYPTDVLVGAALGNFVARFVHDGFLGLPDDVQLSAYVDPAGSSYSLGFSFRF